MIASAILDVTSIEAHLKHSTIFEYFNALEPGEGFIISNDHDPRPLYYQLLSQHGNIFTWEYLEKGPQKWMVKIAKRPTNEREETVGEVAVKDIRKADAFKKFGIDFCCGGKKPVSVALAEAGITEEQFEKEVAQATKMNNGTISHDFNAWDLSFLADYICNVHHKYVLKNGPIIEEIAEKVASKHSGQHPELEEILKGVRQLMNELYQHLESEEKLVFPIIKKLEQGEIMQNPDIVGPIEQMQAEHEDAGEELRLLRRLTREYELPADACNSYAYLYQKLEEFEGDLFQHIHLENNILFPKAVALEKNNLTI